MIIPATYVYPGADVTDGSWLNELGNNTNLYNSVNEVDTPNDADYIQSTTDPSNDIVEVKFDTPTRPTPGSGILRIRHRKV